MKLKPLSTEERRQSPDLVWWLDLAIRSNLPIQETLFNKALEAHPNYFTNVES